MRFKGIFLDLDGTLYAYEKAHEAAIGAVLSHWTACTSLSAQDVNGAIADSRRSVHIKLQGSAASHNRLLYFQGACERLGISSFPLALDSYHLYWDVFIKNAPLYDGVIEFFNVFKHLPILLVTDLTADVQHQKINAFGLASRIKGLVTSEEAGREKPDLVIFNLALQKLGLTAGDVCMIGDDLEKDIVGASAVGIAPFWFDPLGKREKLGTQVSFASYRNFNDIIRAVKNG